MEEKSEEPTPKSSIEAAARRLDRLLLGATEKHAYTKPGKTVRRWLGTSSGAGGKATMADITAAAAILLDPSGNCSNGCRLLGVPVSADTAMEGETTFLSYASTREVESWLVSLSARVLFREKKYDEAYQMVEEGIAGLLKHLDDSKRSSAPSSTSSSSSLYPLLARMYRYRSLVAESLNDETKTVQIRENLAEAHVLATLRRDVDTQATVLNLMLRDLLIHSQSTYCSCSTLDTDSYLRLCSHTLHFLHFSQSNRQTSYWSTRHSQNPLRTTSSVAICTIVDAFKPCA